MKFWLKMRYDLLMDRRLRKLSEHEQLVYFKLNLLAGKEARDGVLPPLEDICLDLFCPDEDEMSRTLERLGEVGLLTYDAVNALWEVSGFREAQEQTKSTERVRRFRAKRKSETDFETADETRCETADETRCETADETRCETADETHIELKIDSEKELKSESESELKSDSEENFLLTPAEREKERSPREQALTKDFLEESVRAEAFINASGIHPRGKEKRLWLRALRQFTSENISIEVMVAAVEKLRADGMMIASPLSVFKVARCLNPDSLRRVSNAELLAEL